MQTCTARTSASSCRLLWHPRRRFPGGTNISFRSCHGLSNPTKSFSIPCTNFHPIPQSPVAPPKLRLKQQSASLPFQTIRRYGKHKGGMHSAFIALGSNVGDRVAMIEQACKEMEASGNIKLLRTSSLWETRAMYILDQENFVNGVCEVKTSLSPLALLDELQAIENRMGRVKVIDKGPRNIDLDILLYDKETVSTDRLQIPHPLMLEREFVLRPLCDIAPKKRHPLSDWLTYKTRLSKLPLSDPPISPCTPLARSLPHITSLDPCRATRIMSILNLTPDSFSDGGKNYNADTASLTTTVKSQIAAGATIIDIGGQSTRPGAVQVSAEEETFRILSTVSIIRSLPEADKIAISIDTYRASVAEAAIQAGADIINDVSAGQMDPDMLATVARLGCTFCIMHMRGTPQTMSQLTDYSPYGVIKTVAHELASRVDEAQRAGIRRWRIILDPGIGFAKTEEQNLELLNAMWYLRMNTSLVGLPWLVGTSRKGFIGRITGVEDAEKRTWGTAATVAVAIYGGADIVRVHDVEEMAQVAKMADAICRVEKRKFTHKQTTKEVLD